MHKRRQFLLQAAHCTWSCFCAVESNGVQKTWQTGRCTHLTSSGDNYVAPPTKQTQAACCMGTTRRPLIVYNKWLPHWRHGWTWTIEKIASRVRIKYMLGEGTNYWNALFHELQWKCATGNQQLDTIQAWVGDENHKKPQFSVAYRRGWFGVFKPPPPEILKISVESSIA